MNLGWAGYVQTGSYKEGCFEAHLRSLLQSFWRFLVEVVKGDRILQQLEPELGEYQHICLILNSHPLGKIKYYIMYLQFLKLTDNSIYLNVQL